MKEIVASINLEISTPWSVAVIGWALAIVGWLLAARERRLRWELEQKWRDEDKQEEHGREEQRQQERLDDRLEKLVEEFKEIEPKKGNSIHTLAGLYTQGLGDKRLRILIDRCCGWVGHAILGTIHHHVVRMTKEGSLDLQQFMDDLKPLGGGNTNIEKVCELHQVPWETSSGECSRSPHQRFADW